MIKLGVNIDHVATLRQARKGIKPEPVYAAQVVQQAGADSVVVHLREDRRHINDQDVFLIKQSLKVKLNLEMSIARDIVKAACIIKPDQVTLVPEKRQELTTEGGLDVAGNFKSLSSSIDKLKNAGIPVSLFIDPVKLQINAAKKIGVKMIELHTGRYAEAKNAAQAKKYLLELKEAASYAHRLGLHVFAGHGLDYENVSKVLGLKYIEELNIGYSIVCRALFVGLDRAVREMLGLIRL